MQVVIQDDANGMLVVMESEGGYAPDVMSDLQSRAIDCYRRAMVERHVLSHLDSGADGE